jgi:Tfp pilus assembly PilM family ATPase
MGSLLTIARSSLSPIGMDAGPGGVRVAQLQRKGGQYALMRAACLELEGETGLASPDGVVSMRLRRMLRQHGFRGRTVAGVGLPDAELHAFEVPDADDPDGVNAVRQELLRLTNQEPSDVQTAYWRLPEGRQGGTSAIGVIAAQPRITALWDLCRAAGLDCRAVDADACALARFGHALRGGSRAATDEIWGMLDVGARGVYLTLCVQDVPILARNLAEGSMTWTQQIADGFGISRASAEVHKRDYGLTAPTGSEATASDNQIAGVITSLLRDHLTAAVLNIERSYAYALHCYPQHRPSTLILVGGGAATRNLDGLLSSKLGIEVGRAEDLITRSEQPCLVDRRSDAARRWPLGELAVAIGLALQPEYFSG